MNPSIPVFLPPDLVLARFCAETGIPAGELTGPATTRAITWQRHCVMFALRQLTSASMAEIGAMFDRDRKAVEKAIDRVADRLEIDPDAPGGMRALLRAIAGPGPTSQDLPAERDGNLRRRMAAHILADPSVSDADAIQAAITLLRSAASPAVPVPPKGL